MGVSTPLRPTSPFIQSFRAYLQRLFCYRRFGNSAFDVAVYGFLVYVVLNADRFWTASSQPIGLAYPVNDFLIGSARASPSPAMTKETEVILLPVTQPVPSVRRWKA